MAPKKSPSVMKIHFNNASSNQDTATSLPFFLTSNGISGSVEISPSRMIADTLRICLQGFLSIQIPQRQPSSQCGPNVMASYRTLNQRTTTLVQNIPVCMSMIARTDSPTSSTPFHLNIITKSGENCNLSGSHSNTLPPTLHHKRTTPSPTSSQAETTEISSSYLLSISAISNNTILETVSQPVRIYDNASEQPPVYQKNTTAEHSTRSSDTFRRNLITKTGTLSAAITTEPRPMVFAPDEDFATTSIPLELTIGIQGVLSELDASITWRLRTTTIASLTPMMVSPTMAKARKLSNAICTTSFGLKHQVTMRLKDWTEANNAYSSDRNLIIALPKAAFLVPTTHTEHLSRRYSVHVGITVSGKQVGKGSVCVETPLQIGYEDIDKDEAPMYLEHEEETPISKYERQNIDD